LGGLTPHWLWTTPSLVTDNFGLGGSASTPPPRCSKIKMAWHGGSFHSRFDRPNRLLYIVRIEAGVRL